MKEQAGSCLHTPTWGVEGILESTSKEVRHPLTIGSTATRGFNGSTEHTNFLDSINTINFDDLLTENSTADTSSVMNMIDYDTFDFSLPEPEASTTNHVTEFVFTTEDVWAQETFDDPISGLCVSAAEAEGARVELPVNMEQEESSLGNNDLLKWILDDNQIGDFSLPTEVEVTTPHFFLQEVEKEEKRTVKTEILTEEEKYRRMREQNNKASQACRAKRKRKQEAEEEELKLLQERNASLRSRVERMEGEVAEYKRMVMGLVTGIR